MKHATTSATLGGSRTLMEYHCHTKRAKLRRAIWKESHFNRKGDLSDRKNDTQALFDFK
ncbi:hypothetical protein F442_01867 [Phytophthora nicotianae P10297]|uniref:Uncharacterized protein n=1 Tax=Phytophthora nicotianae P10297 TaxID=1317064 RepID=W3A216_PHYNI|nr:hypothetical protein F442_01867 [Phytophthora nicotianae P10297]